MHNVTPHCVHTKALKRGAPNAVSILQYRESEVKRNATHTQAWAQVQCAHPSGADWCPEAARPLRWHMPDAGCAASLTDHSPDGSSTANSQCSCGTIQRHGDNRPAPAPALGLVECSGAPQRLQPRAGCMHACSSCSSRSACRPGEGCTACMRVSCWVAARRSQARAYARQAGACE